jgi:putative radical SAM enzyme (TIGR03279 family)
MGTHENIITVVEKDSIGEELGLECGDTLVSINGQAIRDVIDYKYLIADEYIEILVRKKDGEEWLFEVEKEYDEDIGIEFEKPIMDGAKRCANKCIFCFIDQLPPGMRETLYFKDDDSRLSFLQGNFITMTNMSQNDIDRIIRYRISPLNISVHTTDPELRIRMLGNKRAGNILDILKRLVKNGISINCQIVLCRDVNDKDILRKTINDLYLLSPGIRNVAVVPVGISRYRDNLYPLKPFDRESASEVVELIEELQHKIRKAAREIFVRAADEFYIMAGKPLPGPEHYGDYEQLEDGVGMVTNFLENVRNSLKKLDLEEYRGGFSVVTGVSASKYLKGVRYLKALSEIIEPSILIMKNANTVDSDTDRTDFIFFAITPISTPIATKIICKNSNVSEIIKNISRSKSFFFSARTAAVETTR